jgi:hypothetical protein
MQLLDRANTYTTPKRKILVVRHDYWQIIETSQQIEGRIDAALLLARSERESIEID